MRKQPSWLDSLRGLVRFVAPSVGNVFELADIYAHEAALARRFPENRHIRENIRDVLQDLRDLGELQFVGNRGHYRRMNGARPTRSCAWPSWSTRSGTLK